jgi:hypothetical protein
VDVLRLTANRTGRYFKEEKILFAAGFQPATEASSTERSGQFMVDMWRAKIIFSKGYYLSY